MLKRLAVARALLVEPEVLLFDEATHDLDPRGAEEIRDLVTERVRGGAAVVWATQRLEELPGFAHEVTVLDRGTVRFQDSLEQLTSRATTRRFRMRLRHPRADARLEIGRTAMDGLGAIEGTAEHDVFIVDLARNVTLGQAIERLLRAELQVITCSEERSEVETAFLGLTASPGAP
jgi:ABC-type multidrug transport system ATPase subunit